MLRKYIVLSLAISETVLFAMEPSMRPDDLTNLIPAAQVVQPAILQLGNNQPGPSGSPKNQSSMLRGPEFLISSGALAAMENENPFEKITTTLSRENSSEILGLSSEQIQHVLGGGLLEDSARAEEPLVIDQPLLDASTLMAIGIPANRLSEPFVRLTFLQELEETVHRQMAPSPRKRLEYILALLSTSRHKSPYKTFEKRSLVDMNAIGTDHTTLQGNLFKPYTSIGALAIARLLVTKWPTERVTERQAQIDRMLRHARHPSTELEFGPQTSIGSVKHALNHIKDIEDHFLSLYASSMPGWHDPLVKFLKKHEFKLWPKLNKYWLAFSLKNLWSFGGKAALAVPLKQTGTFLFDFITVPGISEQKPLEEIHERLGDSRYFEQFHVLVLSLFYMQKKLAALSIFLTEIETLRTYADKVGLNILATKLVLPINMPEFNFMKEVINKASCDSYQEFFTHLGRILVAYKSVQALQESFVEVYEAVGELDGLVAIVDRIMSHPVPFEKVTFVTDMLPIIDAKHLYNPYRSEQHPPMATELHQYLHTPTTIITGVPQAGKTFFLYSLAGNALLARTIGYAVGSEIMLQPFKSLLCSFFVGDSTQEQSGARAQYTRIAELNDQYRQVDFQPALVIVDEPFSASTAPIAYLEKWFAKVIEFAPGVYVIITTHAFNDVPGLIHRLKKDNVTGLTMNPLNRQLEQRIVTLAEVENAVRQFDNLG